jgi:hypothetical protein
MDNMSPVLLLVAAGWLYVVVMMAAAEASSPGGSVLGALFTLVLYGLGPLALVLYLLATPGRRRRRRAREAAEAAEQAAASAAQPDSGGHAASDTVAAIGKEP